MLEFIFNKVTATLVFCCEYCTIFKNTYFEEHLQTAASVESLRLTTKYPGDPETY